MSDEAGLALWGDLRRYLADEQQDELRKRPHLSVGVGGDRLLRHYVVMWDGAPLGILDPPDRPG